MSEAPGRLPPQNLAAEEQVLGAILFDPTVLPDVMGAVKPHQFYRTGHRAIFEAILRVRAANEDINILTVVDALKRRGSLETAGGPEAVARLADEVSTARRALSHAKLVRAAAQSRALIDAARAVAERASTEAEDPDRLISDALDAFNEIQADAEGEWEILTARSLHDKGLIPPAPLIHGILSEGNVGYIGGEAKMRKTWIACEAALALSSGGLFLGLFQTAGPRPVLFVEEEDHEFRVDNRLSDLWRCRTTASGLPLPENLHLLIRQGVRLDDAAKYARLSALVGRIRPALILFDSLTRIHNLKTSLDSDIKPVLDAIDRLAREHGCAIWTIHHNSKPTVGQSPRGGLRLRGSGDIHARSEDSLYIVGESREGRVVETESKDHEGMRLFVQMEDEGQGMRIWANVMDVEVKRDRKADEYLRDIRELVQAAGEPDARIPLPELTARWGVSDTTARNRVKTLSEKGLAGYAAGTGQYDKGSVWLTAPAAPEEDRQGELVQYGEGDGDEAF